jgi:hypothetical protein
VFLAALFYLPRYRSVDYGTGLVGCWAGLTALAAGVFAWERGGFWGLKARGRLVLAALQLLLCLGICASMFIDTIRKDLADSMLVFSLHAAPFFWCGIVPFWLKGRWRVNLSANAMLSARNLLLLPGVFLILAAWFALFMGKYLFYSEWEFLAVLGLAWVVDIGSWLSRRASRPAIAHLPGHGIPVVYGVCLEAALTLWHGVYSHFSWQQSCAVVLSALLLPALGVMGHRFESMSRRQAGMAERLPSCRDAAACWRSCPFPFGSTTLFSIP